MFKVLLLVKSIYAEEGSIKILMNVPIIVAVESRTTNILTQIRPIFRNWHCGFDPIHNALL